MTELQESLSRRRFAKLLAGGTLAVAAGTAFAATPASAGIGWCRADPEFEVDGLRGNVYVAVHEGEIIESTGPIQLRFLVPVECKVKLVSTDNGLGHGYVIGMRHEHRLKKDGRGIRIEVQMLVPAVGNHAVRAEFVPNGVIDEADYKVGRTNKWIKLKTHLKAPD